MPLQGPQARFILVVVGSVIVYFASIQYFIGNNHLDVHVVQEAEYISNKGFNTTIGQQLIWMSSGNTTIDHRQKIKSTTNETQLQHTNRNIKKILLWNSFYQSKDYGFGLGVVEPFKRWNCSVCDCEVTNNRKDFHAADAVLFFAFHLDPDDIPKRSFPHQIFVFFNSEPPLKSEDVLKGHGTAYNLTFTYLNSTDTDIFVPHGRIIPRRNKNNVQLPTVEFVNSKTKPIFWPVTNCRSQSLRKEYATELNKSIPVDIFGKCGKDVCPKEKQFSCMMKWNAEYKFILAFENGLCEDYVTEKIYSSLKYDLVPVVLGRANYSAIFPPKSYIHVSDFESPKHLGEYLLYLDRNPEEYLEYFKWKQDYESLSPDDLKKHEGFCRLCEILNDASYTYKSNFDIEEYWSPDRLCITGQQEREFIHLESTSQ